MNKKFEKFTGGMKLGLAILAVVVILGIYTSTADASGWVQAASFLAFAAIVILFIRVTGIGRKL